MTVPARPPPHFPPRRGSGLFASFG
ncbi:diacylglycerol kinase, partial [Corallococcus sp. AB038B]